MMPEVDVARHVSYSRRCLNILPGAFTSNDLNRLSLGFFLLNTLDILDHLTSSTTPSERLEWINWIYSCQIPAGGFRGSTGTKSRKESIYDAGHLPASYFAIASLLILGDDLKRVNRRGLLETLRRLQNEDGSFAPVLIGEEKFGEVDVRHLYCAIATREMLSPIKPEEDIDVRAAIRYIQECKSYDGAYAQSPGLESHAGSTYCCIAALSMLDALGTDNEDTVHWLVYRQSVEEEEIGGFNGRVNKPADTCYSFWVGGALDILHGLRFVSAKSNKNYLLSQTYHPQLGGFGKLKGSFPDPLHSGLGLGSLALTNEPHLLPFDAALCITKRSKDRLSTAPWRQ